MTESTYGLSRTPTDLDDLLALIREKRAQDPSLAAHEDGIRWDALPVFGGDEPRDTTGIWSWDETRILYSVDGGDGLAIGYRIETVSPPRRVRS